MSQPYRQRLPETWDAARAAYLDGSTAEEVCDRFHLGLSAFRKRAREQGWRRLDQDDPDPEPFDADEDLPDIDDAALADIAFRQMGVEARRGRVNRALAWARLRDMALRQAAACERLRHRIARDAVEVAIDSPAHPEQRALTPPLERTAGLAKRALAKARELHEVHQIHPVSPVSRADRRRLAAQSRKTGPP